MIELFLAKAFEKKYVVFHEVKGKPYNLNIVGWRNRSGSVDRFCDFIAVYYEDFGKWRTHIWPATTRPGGPGLLNPVNIKGTAILKPGQYLHSHSLGIYKGYLALKQVEPVEVYRDNSHDLIWDEDENKVDKGLFGVHIHKAGLFSKLVGKYSLGCQVFQKAADFRRFISLCEQSSQFFGNKFTYTLLEF